MHTTVSAFSFSFGVVLVLARASAGFAQGTPADSQAIRGLIQAHATAWNQRDAKAAADSAAGGSTHAHPVKSINIRFLRADVAVADVASQFIARPKTGALAPTPETTYLFIVLTKDRRIWHIAQLRNTLTQRL